MLAIEVYTCKTLHNVHVLVYLQRFWRELKFMY